jgi:hypothetical protein
VLRPRFSLLTEPPAGEPTNVSGDPRFIAPYLNRYQATSKGAAFGNFVTTTFLPTGLVGDYHLRPDSAARDVGVGRFRTFFPTLLTDIDGDPRLLPAVEAGADVLR